MNNTDRKELDKAISLIEQAKNIIYNIGESEQSKFDSLSEGLQQTERGQKFEETVSSIEDLVSDLESSISTIEELK